MSRYQAIIFDLFGTIVDGFAASTAGYQEEFSTSLGVPHGALMRHWRQLTDRRTLGEFQTVEDSIQHVCDLFSATPTTEQMTRAVEIRLDLTRRALTPKPDAVATLRELRRDGFKTGLLSNCSIEIPLVWPQTEFAALFDATVFSSLERIKKPAVEIYRLACQRLGAAPYECMYIADGENYELTAAANLGLHSVLIKSPLQATRQELICEANEWQGTTIGSLTEALELARS
jgi:putative hydrolase of the HAD superfamily